MNAQPSLLARLWAKREVDKYLKGRAPRLHEVEGRLTCFDADCYLQVSNELYYPMANATRDHCLAHLQLPRSKGGAGKGDRKRYEAWFHERLALWESHPDCKNLGELETALCQAPNQPA